MWLCNSLAAICGCSRGSELGKATATALYLSCFAICCISETKLIGKWERHIGAWKLINSGTALTRAHGVGVMLSSRAQGSLIDYECISDRLMRCSFALPKSKLHVVSVYAPTNAAGQESKDSFYQALQQVIDRCPKRDMVMIMGDFNAQLGGQDRDM